MRKIAIVRDSVYREHVNGPWHPESPERLQAIDRMLARSPYRRHLVDIGARDARIEELLRIHSEEYVERLERTRGGSRTQLDPDTSACGRSYDAALRSAGGTMDAVDAVVNDGFDAAFAFVRPPGHHAERSRAMGFCLLNNVAIGAEHALRALDLSRILIVDWDVHHGNGTMHSFYGSDKVLYFSVHQFPHYPGTGTVSETGTGKGRGFTVNAPMPAGSGDRAYAKVFERVLRPIALEYQPQLVLVSAGFDAHSKDPLANMRVTNRGYRYLTGLLRQIAGQWCDGRIALVLEGGYDLEALPAAVSHVLLALIEEDDTQSTLPSGSTSDTTAPNEALAPDAVIDNLTAVQREYWSSL